jgi:alpha-L-fucosidase
MRRTLACLLLVGVGANGLAAQAPAASWEALRARPIPQWFQDAKLGIFIHWGVYSVPAYSGREQYAEWFLRGLQLGDTLRTRFLRQRYGENFGYRDFAPLFQAELFDPAEWADLFRRAGARYVVLTAKHHDGFALWPSRYSPGWNSAEVGPRRDLVGELSTAVRAAGLRMGLYYSLPEWDHPLYRWGADPPERVHGYVAQHLIPQFRELVTAYRPELLFTDGEWDHPAETWHARELISWYLDAVGPEAVVNDRWGAGSDVGFRTPEYSSGLPPGGRPWAEVRGLGRSFGLNRNEPLEAYLDPASLVHRFAAAVARGGGMILNVGPAADGQIPLLQQERLRQLGSWLERNGEAIYGAGPWKLTGEESEVSFERVDSVIDIDWVRNSPSPGIREDGFTGSWRGYIEVPHSGRWRFEVAADDAARVVVDGRVVAERGDAAALAALHRSVPGPGLPRDTGAIELQAGMRYQILIGYVERELNASIRLFWVRPDGEREIVPAGQFSRTPGAAAGSGLIAAYRSQQYRLVYTRRGNDLYAIVFWWPGRNLVLSIGAPQPGTRVSLLGLERLISHPPDLPWEHRDGRLRVDLSGLEPGQLPGQWAWTFKLANYFGGGPG